MLLGLSLVLFLALMPLFLATADDPALHGELALRFCADQIEATLMKQNLISQYEPAVLHACSWSADSGSGKSACVNKQSGATSSPWPGMGSRY